MNGSAGQYGCLPLHTDGTPLSFPDGLCLLGAWFFATKLNHTIQNTLNYFVGYQDVETTVTAFLLHCQRYVSDVLL